MSQAMHNSGDNPRFEVLINGQPTTVVGIERTGVLAISLDWVRRRLEEKPSDCEDEQWWVGNRIQLRVGGLDSVRNKHVEWHKCQLKVGDEVTLRVLPPGEFDTFHEYDFGPDAPNGVD